MDIERRCEVCSIFLNDDNESDEFPGYCHFCVENNHIVEEDLPQITE